MSFLKFFLTFFACTVSTFAFEMPDSLPGHLRVD